MAEPQQTALPVRSAEGCPCCHSKLPAGAKLRQTRLAGYRRLEHGKFECLVCGTVLYVPA